MSYAAYSTEQVVRDRMSQLGISAVALARVAGVPPSRLNLVLTNVKDFSPEDAALFRKLTSTLVEIQDAFAPLGLNFNDPKMVQTLLTKMKESEVTSADIAALVRKLFEPKIAVE
jgi:hypothetical protein